MLKTFEPKFVCFFCKWCASAGADFAGTSRLTYSPNGIIIRVLCSGRVDPLHILWAFKMGADGVLVGGCHPGDCHYSTGNHMAAKRIALLKVYLKEIGIEPQRLRLEWISATESKKVVEVVNSFTEELRFLGPLTLEQEGPP